MISRTHIAAAAAMATVMLALMAGADQSLTGNGCPSGAHYNLNIIGVANPKTADMTDTSGHSIFVPLEGNAKINLALAPEGESFAVLDRNGTDGNGAKFQLPAADPLNTGTTSYSVFARPLGKPNGKAKMTTGAIDPLTGEEVYSVCVLNLERTKGPQKFENVSKELLYIYAYVYAGPGLDGIPGTADDVYTFQRVPLFDAALQDYFWSYDNAGLKLLQLRFYEGVATTVPDVVTISPTAGLQGTVGLVLTITGTDIALGTGATVTFANAGITVTSITRVDYNTLSVTIDIAADAALGVGSVTVTRTDDGKTFLGGFEVLPAL
ncbi:MAG: hypothetical protein M1376_14665 [Planctomycetes bacterium]|nr:hypothetical protein [Planctomycetota bacterium]